MGAIHNETYFFPRRKKRAALDQEQFALFTRDVLRTLGREPFTLVHGKFDLPFTIYSDLGDVITKDADRAGLTRRYRGKAVEKLIAQFDRIDWSNDDICVCAAGFGPGVGGGAYDSVPLLLYRLHELRPFEVHSGPEYDDDFEEVEGTEFEKVEEQAFLIALASDVESATKKIRQVLRPHFGNIREVPVYLH